MSLTTMFIGLSLSIVLVVSALFVWSLLLTGFDLDRAVERTTRSVSGLVLGIASAGTLIASEILGGLVALVTTAPGEIAQLLLGAVGYLSISGIISIQPETWGLLSIGLTAAIIILGERRMESGGS